MNFVTHHLELMLFKMQKTKETKAGSVVHHERQWHGVLCAASSSMHLIFGREYRNIFALSCHANG